MICGSKQIQIIAKLKVQTYDLKYLYINIFQFYKMQSKNYKRQSNDTSLKTTDHKHKQNLEWQQIKTPSTQVPRRSCHSSCIHKNKLYIYGGYDNNTNAIIKDMFEFSFDELSWKTVQQKGQLPGPRHSHTTVLFNEQIYMFGGMHDTMDNNNKLHLFDLKNRVWKQLKTISCPKPIDSHRAVIYGQDMILGLGYSEGEYNPNLYALNLNNLDWRTIFSAKQHKDKQHPSARAQGSMNIYNNTLIIYAGKNFNAVFQDLWMFDLKNLQFKQIQVSNHLQGRFGHSGVIYQDHLFIFGGTRGVTHQRNDLISINLINFSAKICWPDSQQQRLKIQQHAPNAKKNYRDSTSKLAKKQTENQQYDISTTLKSAGKYRNQLREVNYYNQLYDNKRHQLHFAKKIRKNQLLTELQTFQSNQSLNLTSTFEVLTNSIMQMTQGHTSKQQKNETNSESNKKSPKSRDNYTADLHVGTHDSMVIFGGGMHKISFNDVILVDLKAILYSTSPSETR